MHNLVAQRTSNDAQSTSDLSPSLAAETARPFVKWVGGKSRLVPALRARLPLGVEQMRYVEPFLGGAALFFALRPASARLSDVNEHLLTTYRTVRDRPEHLLERLGTFERAHSHDAFYAARRRYNAEPEMDPTERAALFIYLNKTCFNGLYRVNRDGGFNAPIGRYTKPNIADAVRIRAASVALRGVELSHASFESLLASVKAGDFVYLDPPYVPLSNTARFTAYGPGSFSLHAQARLHSVFDALDRRGAKLLLSNSDTPWVREQYRHFRVETVRAPRAINCDARQRGHVSELVIRNYETRH